MPGPTAAGLLQRGEMTVRMLTPKAGMLELVAVLRFWSPHAALTGPMPCTCQAMLNAVPSVEGWREIESSGILTIEVNAPPVAQSAPNTASTGKAQALDRVWGVLKGLISSRTKRKEKTMLVDEPLAQSEGSPIHLATQSRARAN